MSRACKKRPNETIWKKMCWGTIKIEALKDMKQLIKIV